MSAQVFAREMRLAINFATRDHGQLADRQTALAQLLADYREECRRTWEIDAARRAKGPQSETKKRKA